MTDKEFRQAVRKAYDLRLDQSGLVVPAIQHAKGVCRKCLGSGLYENGRVYGDCFPCGGTGKGRVLNRKARTVATYSYALKTHREAYLALKALEPQAATAAQKRWIARHLKNIVRLGKAVRATLEGAQS